MATDAQLETARDFVGADDPTDSELRLLIDESGSPYSAALKIIRRRRADLLNGPASFTTDGYSENNTETIKQLSTDIDRLQILIGPTTDPDGDGQPDGGFLTRPDRRCR